MAPFSFPSSSRSLYSHHTASWPNLVMHGQHQHQQDGDGGKENEAGPEPSSQAQQRDKGKTRVTHSASVSSEFQLRLALTRTSHFFKESDHNENRDENPTTARDGYLSQTLSSDEPDGTDAASCNDDFYPAPEYSIREPAGWLRLRRRGPRCPLLSRSNEEAWRDMTIYYSRATRDQVVFIREEFRHSRRVTDLPQRPSVSTCRPVSPVEGSSRAGAGAWRRGVDLVRGRKWWRRDDETASLDEKAGAAGEKATVPEPTCGELVWGNGDVKSPAYTASDRGFDPAQREAHLTQFKLRRHAEERCEGYLLFKHERPKPYEYIPKWINEVSNEVMGDQEGVVAQLQQQNREQEESREFLTFRASPAHQPGMVVRRGVGQASLQASNHRRRRRTREEWWCEARMRYWRYRRNIRARWVKQRF